MSNVLVTIAGLNAFEHVPQTTAKLPVLVFLPGKGEQGTNANLLLVNGPSKFIGEGWNPTNMIVVSVQQQVDWPNPAYVDKIVEAVKSRYAGKSNGQLFMTGLSAGAYGIINYIGKDPAYAAKITGVVLFSEVAPETYFNPANFTMPAWGLCGNQDSWYNKMKALFENNGKKFTTYQAGHGGWNTFYNPGWTENGTSIYGFLTAIGSTVTPPDPEPEPEPTDAPYPVAVLMSDGTQWPVTKKA